MNTFEKLSQLNGEADNFGFMWHDVSQIFEQIRSECEEIEENIKEQGSHSHLQEEIGDLLHAVFCLCLYTKFNPEETLIKSLDKFEKRFGTFKKLVHDAGYDTLKGQPVEVLMYFWTRAKQGEVS